MECVMSLIAVSPQLALRNVRKVIVAGAGSCRVRVTVLGGVSLQLMPGEALGVTGALPLARSMLCAVAAGVARCDSGSVRWGPRGVSAVRYAPAGDAPRVLQRRDGAPPGLVILDAALVEHAPQPDVRAVVKLLESWLAEGGAALVAAPLTAGEWPWAMLELAGGQLRPLLSDVISRQPAWSAPARMVAASAHLRVAEGAPDQ